jgi:beta-lactam-binding protein with PASTA domain
VGHAYSRERKKGIVISQSRRPGRVLPANTKINLVVSRGRRR